MLQSCAAGAIALLPAGPAFAQEIDAPDTTSDTGHRAERSQDIVVTGSRIVRDGFQAPTPVSVVTMDEINRAAPTTIADFVNQLPSLNGSITPRSNNGGLTEGLTGANLLNLRSLGISRTLVLLNGRRVTPSVVDGAVDVNTLPTPLVSRVDVVTGGASAAYGSDAIAGVVNFVLDTRFEGIKGSIQSGITSRGDGANVTGDLSYGASFAGGRGHLLLSGTYSKQKLALAARRGWFKAYKVVNNPAFAPGNGEPQRLMLPWTSLLMTAEGLIASGPLRGYAFDANGQVATTSFTFPPIISSVLGGGSEAAYRQLDDLSQHHAATLPLERGALYGRLSFDASDSMTLFAEGSYGDSMASVDSATFFRTGNVLLRDDNFFLPQQVKTAMADAEVTTVPLSTSNRKFGIMEGTYARTNTRVLGGLEGNLSDRWSYGLSFQYGRADITNKVHNNVITANYAAAIDAIDNPAAPGTPICRSTLADPGNGCVPVNPLGTVPLTADQAAYVVGTSRQDTVFRQDVAEAFLNGDLLDLPAGPVSIAVGGQYRREKVTATADAIATANGFFSGNFKPFSGRYRVKEGYGEIAIPILKDQPLASELSLNAAGRITDYSTSGTVFTWKLGGTYKPVSDLTFRVTRSRDIRAPTLYELFNTALVFQVNVSDPTRGGANALVRQVTSGNPDLKPERADTTTLGVVYAPSWLAGLQLSVDYYDIRIDEAIAITSSQQIVNRCSAGEDNFCSLIQRNDEGIITQVNQVPFNALTQIARGIDVEASYRTSFGGGDLELRGLLNYVSKLDTISPGLIISRAGEVGNNLDAARSQGVPRIRALVTAAYARDNVLLQLKGRLIGKSQVERSYGPADIDINKVPAIFYTDAYLSYKIPSGNGEAELFFAVENLFDTDPPPSQNQDNANVLAHGVSVGVYDVLGRAFRVGARFRF